MAKDEYVEQEKERKKMAADVRAESSDAHVRDLQSKYLERFSCSTKKK